MGDQVQLMRHSMRLCDLSHLSTHTRFRLTLRTTSEPKHYHKLLLFRLSPLIPNEYDSNPELYCMESICPHMGAGMSHAPITSTGPEKDEELQEGEEGEGNGLAEDMDERLNIALEQEMKDMEDLVDPGSKTITCPWHRYDFDLDTGQSSTGMSMCVYKVEVRGNGAEGQREVWVEEPELEGEEIDGSAGSSGAAGSGRWEVVELRGVSEEFADPPPATPTPHACQHGSSPTTAPQPSSTPLPPLPPTLIQSALLILQTPSPTSKITLTRQALSALRSGTYKTLKPTRKDIQMAKELFDPEEGKGWRAEGKEGFVPPREGLEEVEPGKVGRRGKGGSEKSRILMLHALANIEQWAIDLAWDIMARFADFEVNGEKLPVEFFLDWAKVAEDEAKHFSLLSRRLTELGSHYGAHTVHAGLWDSALETSTSLLDRLAIIHLVAEARGLDVNPVTIEKFRRQGDLGTVEVLEVIHNDEITHVTTGHRYFSLICAKMGIDPITTFRSIVQRNFRGKIKGPYNVEDRLTAGMTGEWYEDLEGHGDFKSGKGGMMGVRRDGKVEGDERVHPRLT